MSEEEYENWINAADIDEKSAHILLAGKAYSSCVFHCQQAVEKHIKAILYFAGRAPYSHSLTNLIKSIAETKKIAIPNEIKSALANLDFHYAASRYPGPSKIEDIYNEELALQATGWMKTCRTFLTTIR